MSVKVLGPIENTVRPFDDAQNELAIAGDQAYLLYSLADGAEMRDNAQAESEPHILGLDRLEP